MLLPLALAQFICSYAASNMNVAISSIAQELHTTVQGVQLTITLFTLIMAAFMIPGSKLTDIWGRKRCFTLGLSIYGIGTIIAALAPSLTVLVIGYSIFEGIGTALLIPPVYILVTISYPDLTQRARSFGIISGMGGIGAAAGPLIGGIITTAISWRAAFLLQTLVVGTILFLGRKIVDKALAGVKPKFDIIGTILSALGLISIVVGILQANTYGFFTAKQNFYIGNSLIIPEGGISPVWLFIAVGAIILGGFFFYEHFRETGGRDPLLSLSLFKNKASNLGLITQNVQWLVLQGSSFVISVFLQTVRGFTAIATGLMLTPATIGLLLSSATAGKLAKNFSQRALIRWGFIITLGGLFLLLLLARATSPLWSFIPGLFLLGIGVGVMLTSSVNVVQSAFPEEKQGEISGLSRSVSNLGSSLGTAIVGTILVATATIGNKAYANAAIAMIVIAVIGLLASLLLPPTNQPSPRGKR